MYRWIVFLHVAGLLGFLLSHGASASMAFALRRERKLERIRALLDLSSSALGTMYGSLLLLLISGIIAGFMGNWWGYGWIWLSLGLLIALLIVMYYIGTRHYTEVRRAVGLGYMQGTKQHPPVEPASPEEIDALLARSRPVLLLAAGIGALVVIVWLMMFKPF